MEPEQTGKDRCEAADCVTHYEESAHYYVITEGIRTCLCAPCWLKREHEFIRKRQQDDAANKGKP